MKQKWQFYGTLLGAAIGFLIGLIQTVAAFQQLPPDVKSVNYFELSGEIALAIALGGALGFLVGWLLGRSREKGPSRG